MAEETAITDNLPGARIRQLRRDHGLGVRQLAAIAGVSAATVSQVERGINDPSLETLRQLAEALSVPLFDLFSAPSGDSVSIQRVTDRVEVASPHHQLRFTQLSPPGGLVEVLSGTLEPGGYSSKAPHAHPATEVVIVESGELVVEVATERYSLRRGDSCQFDSRLPHRYLNAGRRSCRFTLAVTPPSY